MKRHSKKHIFLFDGTWNSAALGRNKDITNIFRLNVALSTHDKQGRLQYINYYPGPGSRGIIDKTLGGMFGNGIDQIILEAYVNLSSNYCPGDKIYIFGFSRGAIAARALTGVISKCGLLRSEETARLARVWRYFLSLSVSEQDLESKHKHIDAFTHGSIKIEFVGLFDAVIGRPYNEANRFSRLRFGNNAIDKNVKAGVHILSIDDRRVRYHPILWDDKLDEQSVEQIWMPGVHGDIGGIGKTNFVEIVSLLTMIDRLFVYTDLQFEEFVLNKMVSRLFSHSEIIISNELESMKMRLLRTSRRQPPKNAINQFKSALFDGIYKEKIFHGNSLKSYDLPHHVAFSKLPILNTIYDDSIFSMSETIVQANS